MLLNRDIIIKPYHTEKSFGLRKFQDPSCLTFVVNKKANKNQILAAFKSIYNVEPVKINILNRKPKATRYTNSGHGFTKGYKLAFIILPKGMQIAITKDEMEEAVKASESAAEVKEAKPKAAKAKTTTKKVEKEEVTEAAAEETKSE